MDQPARVTPTRKETFDTGPDVCVESSPRRAESNLYAPGEDANDQRTQYGGCF